MSTMLSKQDPAVFATIQHEIEREEFGLELIASENYVSPAVLEALGSVMTNKYAEGYPRKRYYGGCECVDEVEELAIERAKQLFGADHVNVQPHSGSQANMGVYLAVLKPGDTIFGMDLKQGGHLTHGSPVNFSGKLFKVVSYGLHPEAERLDMENVARLAKEHRPKLIVCGASAYSRDIDFAAFRKIADDVGALLMADIAHPAGLVAAKLHSDPVPYCDFVTTTTHKTLRGPRGGMIMCRAEHAKAINSSIFPGIQGGPLMHVIAAKAVAFGEALAPAYKDYCRHIIENAQAMAKRMVEHGYRIVSGGTDNHLLLIDLTARGISGKEAEDALGQAAITVNKNTVPNETRSPFVTSGIRIGTPAITTRGMGVAEMKLIADWIDEVLQSPTDEAVLACVRGKVVDMCKQFPIHQSFGGRGHA